MKFFFLVSTNGDNNGSLVTKYYLLHNTTVASLKVREDIDREHRRDKKSIKYFHFS